MRRSPPSVPPPPPHVSPGHNTPFTTSNYKITTTPEAEWRLVTTGDTAGHNMQHGRRLPGVEELLQSDTAIAAHVTRIEAVVTILYTGPMYLIYNTILRRFPENLYKEFADGDNLYSSTIHALVSAVQKLSKVVRIPEGFVLYRGLGGALELPDYCWKADANGSRGCVALAHTPGTRGGRGRIGAFGDVHRTPQAEAVWLTRSATMGPICRWGGDEVTLLDGNVCTLYTNQCKTNQCKFW